MSRIFSAALIALTAVATGGVFAAPNAWAGSHKMCSTLPDGTVYCYVVKDPDPPPGEGSGSVGDSQCKDNGQVISCAGPSGSWWDASHTCYAIAMNPPPPAGSALWEGHTPGTGIVYRCLGGQGAGFFWSADKPPRPTPAQLAQRALAKAKAKAPRPAPERYPAGTLRDGTPYTVVRGYTWYWTPSSTYQSFEVTASEGGESATATVTPEALTFLPGDGHSAVSCNGPGSVWREEANGPWDPSPSGCQYRYPHSTIHAANHEVTATYAIRWKVTWTGTGGVGGDLPGFETTATSQFAVAEVQSVVTH